MKNLENESTNLEMNLKPLKKLSKNIVSYKLQIAEEMKLEATRIAEVVCKYYNVKFGQLMSNYRGNEVVEARQMAMYLVKEKTDLKPEQIAVIFKRDRTTFLYSYAKIDALLRSKVRDDIKIDLYNLYIII